MLNKLQRTDEALEALETFRAHTTEDEDSHAFQLPLLGELLCKKHRWDEAVEVIDDAIAQNLELPASLLYNYGVALLRTGDEARARQAFDDVIGFYPNYGLAYDALASIDAQEGAALCREGKFEEAIPKLFAASRRTPKPTTLYNLALALLKERRAEEAKESFEALLAVEPSHANAAKGLEAAELMIEGGNYKPKKANDDAEAEGDDAYGDQDDGDAYPSPAVAPKKRIYQIATEKGVGGLASQDDMVMLLSGIEEWVAAALGPLERRVVSLEQAAESAGGLVGSASEDRAVLQLLFDRVQTLEASASSGGSYLGGDDEQVEESSQFAASVGPTPDLADRFNAAALSSKVATVGQETQGLQRRIAALETMLLGGGSTHGTANSHSRRPKKVTGLGLLAEEDEEEEEDAQTKTEDLSSSHMSIVARLAVQEQRFSKMSAELEAQSHEIHKLKRELAASYSRPSVSPGRVTSTTKPRPPPPPKKLSMSQRPGQPPPPPPKVKGIDGPNLLDELKAVTKRRAAKRREMGLTLHD